MVRTDLRWYAVEKARGEYDWSTFDKLTELLKAKGIRPYYILSGRINPLYCEKVDGAYQYPHNPQAVAGFARWATAAVERYADCNPIWEIYNEPNTRWWLPKPSYEEYAQLALKTSQAIRRQFPNAVILGPASSHVDFEYVEGFLKNQGLSAVDAVSVHPYREPWHAMPETMLVDYDKLSSLIERYNHDKRAIPIICGECGFTSTQNAPQCLSELQQAAYLVRMQMMSFVRDIPLTIWYNWRNKGTNGDDGGSNYGLTYSDGLPKPAYFALRTMIGQLSGYQFVRQLTLDSDKDYAYLFRNDQNLYRLVVWATGAMHDAEISLPGKDDGILPIMYMNGMTSKVTVKDGGFKLLIKDEPQYIDLGSWRNASMQVQQAVIAVPNGDFDEPKVPVGEWKTRPQQWDPTGPFRLISDASGSQYLFANNPRGEIAQPNIGTNVSAPGVMTLRFEAWTGNKGTCTLTARILIDGKEAASQQWQLSKQGKSQAYTVSYRVRAVDIDKPIGVAFSCTTDQAPIQVCLDRVKYNFVPKE
jgi:hypothetical protein